MRFNPVSVPVLLVTLSALPGEPQVAVNRLGNLAVLDEAGNYIGWIDFRDGTGKYNSVVDIDEEGAP